LDRVHAEMKLSVTFETYNNRVFQAKITRLYPELDREMHTRLVEASLIEKVEVVPGMFARISIPFETVANTIMVPDRAIIVTPQGEKVVFVVEGGKAFSREVRLGIEQDRMVQITEGIAAGDSIVVSGNQKLQDGMEVSILKKEPSPKLETREESTK